MTGHLCETGKTLNLRPHAVKVETDSHRGGYKCPPLSWLLVSATELVTSDSHRVGYTCQLLIQLQVSAIDSVTSVSHRVGYKC